jgi:hypothetical protein
VASSSPSILQSALSEVWKQRTQPRSKTPPALVTPDQVIHMSQALQAGAIEHEGVQAALLSAVRLGAVYSPGWGAQDMSRIQGRKAHAAVSAWQEVSKNGGSAASAALRLMAAAGLFPPAAFHSLLSEAQPDITAFGQGSLINLVHAIDVSLTHGQRSVAEQPAQPPEVPGWASAFAQEAAEHLEPSAIKVRAQVHSHGSAPQLPEEPQCA